MDTTARVLLVEDVGSQAYMMRRVLERGGHSVVHVDRAKGAFKTLARGEAFDLVLCDYRLPDLDGFTLYQLVQERLALTPLFIMVTAFAEGSFTSAREQLPEDAEEREWLEAGVYDILCKPVKPRRLLDLVARAARGELGSAA